MQLMPTIINKNGLNHSLETMEFETMEFETIKSFIYGEWIVSHIVRAAGLRIWALRYF